MDSRAQLIAALAAVFPVGERVVVDESVVVRLTDSFGDLVDPGLETVMAGGPGGIFRGTYHGLEGMLEAWRDWLATWERVEFEAVDAELAPHGVISLVKQIGVTKHDSVEIEQPSAAAFIFRGDLIERIEFHLDREAAYRAAGQSSQA